MDIFSSFYFLSRWEIKPRNEHIVHSSFFNTEEIVYSSFFTTEEIVYSIFYTREEIVHSSFFFGVVIFHLHGMDMFRSFDDGKTDISEIRTGNPRK